MGLLQSVFGSVYVSLVSADPSATITQLNEKGIVLEALSIESPLTITFSVRRSDFKKLKQICNSFGYSLKINKLQGLYWSVKYLLHRPVLMSGMVLLLAMSLYVPGRIFFVQVEGNTTIPANYVLEKASDCGIGFGAKRRDVRSEKMKNTLLERIPQLQWAGINTTGCVAVITVKEKTISQEADKLINSVTSVVASRDGIIQKCNVTKGNPLCSVGQAVKAGQVLVSGYTDCGLSIQATQSEAEIFALTNRQITAKSVAEAQHRGEILKSEKKFSIQIGKKLINFFNNSGISDATCVKIYDSKALTLPGGFVLPISFVTQTCTYYVVSDETRMCETDFDWVSDHAREHLNSVMVAGQILSSDGSGRLLENVYIFDADYTCYEMIGQIKKEEIIQ